MGLLPGKLQYPLPLMTPWTPFYSQLMNGWVVYANGFFYPAYGKDATGKIHMRGAMMNGANAQMYNMPAGMRPLNSQAFSVVCYNGSVYSTGEISIASNGNLNIWVPSGYNKFVDISGVYWDTV